MSGDCPSHIVWPGPTLVERISGRALLHRALVNSPARREMGLLYMEPFYNDKPLVNAFSPLLDQAAFRQSWRQSTSNNIKIKDFGEVRLINICHINFYLTDSWFYKPRVIKRACAPANASWHQWTISYLPARSKDLRYYCTMIWLLSKENDNRITGQESIIQIILKKIIKIIYILTYL